MVLKDGSSFPGISTVYQILFPAGLEKSIRILPSGTSFKEYFISKRVG
jgi:hypothetical protein